MRRIPLYVLFLLAASAVLAAPVDLRVDKLWLQGDCIARLDWTGGIPSYEVYRSDKAGLVVDPLYFVDQTLDSHFDDFPPPGDVWYYQVRERGDCLQPIGDATVRSDQPAANFGAGPSLDIGNVAATTRAYLKFNLDMIPPGSLVSDARLYVKQNSFTGTAGLELARANGPWGETVVTWNSQPGGSGVYGVLPALSGQARVSMEATPLVQAWVDGSLANDGVVLVTESGAGTSEASFESREKGDETAPRLCVTFTSPRARALEELEVASIIPPAVRFVDGIAESLEIEVPGFDPDPVIGSMQFVDANRVLYGLEDPQTQLFLDRVTDVGGPTVVVFGLREGQVPVHGQRISVLSEAGTMLMVTATLKPDLNLTGDLRLYRVQATDVAITELSLVGASAEGEPMLEYFEGRLAWRIVLNGESLATGSEGQWSAWVDTDSGALLHSRFDAVDAGDRAGEEFDIETANGTSSSTCWILSTADDEWFDEAGPTGYPGSGPADPFDDGSDAFALTHSTYHYFFDEYGFQSWDRDAAQVEVMVHANVPGRASYVSGCDHLRFDDGEVVEDIFVHEYTHALVSWGPELEYENQSGAINESLADTFGAILDSSNWRIGELAAGGTVRDMGNPPAFGHPDHMLGSISGDGVGKRPDVVANCDRSDPGYNDCGFVHTNSGILNKAAWLMGHGGFHNGFTIGTLGRPRVSDLYIRTLYSLNDSSNFMHLRDTAVIWARRWMRSGDVEWMPAIVCDVINAFAAVGLGDPDTDCDGEPNLPTDDGDHDGYADSRDNCPTVSNPGQNDRDLDGLGDLCDLDADDDGVPNDRDNCPLQWNAPQADSDFDGRGDLCDDDDMDGVLDLWDNCPTLANPSQSDDDFDMIGNACDFDRDGDGVVNPNDNCPDTPNATQANTDTDPLGNACDNCDFDDNVDQADADRDGDGDACDFDIDGDGIDNANDNCPDAYNPRQHDPDGNGIGLWCDVGELEGLDGLRIAQDLIFNMLHADTTLPVRFPVFPCRDDTCPAALPAVQNVEVEVQVNPAYLVRIVDDQGATRAKADFDPSGSYVLDFPVDPQFFNDDGVSNVPFKGRQYFLELFAPPGSQASQQMDGSVRVTSDQGGQ